MREVGRSGTGGAVDEDVKSATGVEAAVVEGTAAVDDHVSMWKLRRDPTTMDILGAAAAAAPGLSQGLGGEAMAANGKCDEEDRLCRAAGQLSAALSKSLRRRHVPRRRRSLRANALTGAVTSGGTKRRQKFLEETEWEKMVRGDLDKAVAVRVGSMWIWMMKLKRSGVSEEKGLPRVEDVKVGAPTSSLLLTEAAGSRDGGGVDGGVGLGRSNWPLTSLCSRERSRASVFTLPWVREYSYVHYIYSEVSVEASQGRAASCERGSATLMKGIYTGFNRLSNSKSKRQSAWPLVSVYSL